MIFNSLALMKRVRSKGIILTLCVMGCLLVSSQSYAAQIVFYPDEATHVNRFSPDESFVGVDTDLKVRDLGLNLNDGNIANNLYYPARTYIKFDTDALIEKLSGVAIVSATLHLYETGRTYLRQTSDVIHLRSVNNDWPQDDSFTWNDQESWRWDGDDIFASLMFDATNEGQGWKTWQSSAISGNDLSQLIQGWVTGDITNYGLVLENDVNAKWWNPALLDEEQLNELEVLFRRDNVYLTVSVVPEPITIIPFAMGIGFLGLLKIRRKQSTC